MRGVERAVIATLVDYGEGDDGGLAWEFDVDYDWDALAVDGDLERLIGQLAFELYEHVQQQVWVRIDPRESAR
jgi:hypothetical protein